MDIQSFFSPPIFEGQERKTRQAVTLNASLWTIVAVLSVGHIGALLDSKVPLPLSLLNLALLLTCLAARYLLHQGRVKLASTYVLYVATLYLTVILALLGTVRSPVTTAYLLVVIIAGMQFDRKVTIRTTLGISFILLGLILAEQNHLLNTPDYSVGVTVWLSYTFLFGLTSNLTLFVINTNQRYLQRAEEEIEQRKQVEKTLTLYSKAIEYNPISIVITDPDGNIEDVNPKFLEVTGYSREEIIGENPRVLKSDYHSAQFYEDLWKTISSGQEWSGVFKNKKQNGELYWENVSIAPIIDEEGVITHYLSIKEDITNQKEAKETLEKNNNLLEAKLKEVMILKDELHHQAMRDTLTGLHNRRYMEDTLEKELARAERDNTYLSIILLDLDFLKKLNTLGGHATGDYALRSLASQLSLFTRRSDAICRYGGDEFVIILPNTTPEDAYNRAEEIRKKVALLTMLYRSGQPLRITFTAGVATYPIHGKTIDETLSCADAALHSAKQEGRNRVTVYSPGNTELLT